MGVLSFGHKARHSLLKLPRMMLSQIVEIENASTFPGRKELLAADR